MTDGTGLSLRCGVVCAGARRSARPDLPAIAEGYVIAGDGRVAWLEADGERHAPTDGAGWVVAAISGEGGDEGAAFTAMNAVARVLAKLHQPVIPREPLAVLRSWLGDAHRRMAAHLALRGRHGVGASVALLWALDDVVVWVELGTARIWLRTGGRTRRLGASIPFADAQRVLRGSVGLGDDAAVHLRPGVNCGSLRVADGDRLILGTAGLWGGVDEGALASLAAQLPDAQDAAVALHERAVHAGRGGATVLVADVVGDAPTDALPRPTLQPGAGHAGTDATSVRRPPRPRRPGRG